MTRHQYGISTVVARTSFRGKTSGGDSKCDDFPRLSFSQIAANVARISKIFRNQTGRLVNERLGRLLSHVAFRCSNFRRKSLPLFSKLLVASGDTTTVVL